MRIDKDNLLMLGGSSNPSGSVKYSIPSDSWTIMPDLPFKVESGACATSKLLGETLLLLSVLDFDTQSLDHETDDCFVYGKDRELYGADRNEASATNVENAEDCQFICQE